MLLNPTLEKKNYYISNLISISALNKVDKLLEQIPTAAKEWAEKLPSQERSYVLSLCHFLCAATPEVQAEFLDGYTADGLIVKTLQDKDAHEKVKNYLHNLRITTEISVPLLRKYIRQFYIHSAQDKMHRTSGEYLESALRLFFDPEEQNHILSYVLGFEVIKTIFKMSWQQHERLYRLQNNQEEFFYTYIKPIQKTHRINGIVTPKDEKIFFAKRSYFVQEPQIGERKITELMMATFSTEIVSNLGFSIIRNPSYINFDYEYIYKSEQEEIFC